MYEHYDFENIFEIMILKTNSLLIEFEFYAQTSEEKYKRGSNIVWYIDFRVFYKIP